MKLFQAIIVPAFLVCSLSSFGDDIATSSVKMEGDVAFTEGPVWHPSDNVYFSDIRNNRIMRRDANGQMHVFRAPSGRTNGMVFDLQGRLICCEGGGAESNRRVTRTELNGTITVLATHYQSKRLNSPNDITIDSRGRLYFSDPRYRDRRSVEQVDKHGQQIDGVYRIDLDGTIDRIIAHEVDRPNGIAISPDDRHLFVADNNNDRAGNNRKLWRFDLLKKGNVDLDSRKLLFDWGTDRGPDGMAIDSEGRLYVTAGFNRPNPPAQTSKVYKTGIYVITSDGKLVDFIPVSADMITNCCFGGVDRKTLFITAGHVLWSVRVKTPGHVAWPAK